MKWGRYSGHKSDRFSYRESVVKEFLEESTNMVKFKRNLGKIILLSTYFIVWVVAMVVFWQTKGPMTSGFNITFRWILLPLLLFASTIVVEKNNYWGKENFIKRKNIKAIILSFF